MEKDSKGLVEIDITLNPPGASPRVTVVILNYNGLRYLKDCLSSVLADDYSDKAVLFADNASSDGSVEFVRREFPGVRLIANAENLGFPRGCNEAARLTDSEIVVLLNMDTKVETGWLRELMKVLDEHPRAVLAGSKLFLGDGIHLQHAGGVIHDNFNTSHIGYNELDDGRFNEVVNRAYVTGASVAIRRTFLEEVGYLDEGYPLYYEDTDLCIQAHRLSYEVLFAPASRAIHYETVGTVRDSFKYTYRYHRGRVRCVFKNLPLRVILRRWISAERRWWKAARPVVNPGAIWCAYGTNLLKFPLLWWQKRFGKYRHLLRRGWDFKVD